MSTRVVVSTTVYAKETDTRRLVLVRTDLSSGPALRLCWRGGRVDYVGPYLPVVAVGRCGAFGLQWFIFPLVVNVLTNLENSNIRAKNIMNLCFDVSTQTYNQYIDIFYLIETTIASLAVYILIMIDFLLISLCSAIISQQDVLINTFKSIGHNEEPQINHYKEIKSILQDQLQLNLKIKLFYSIMKPTILLSVAMDSFYFIILTYLFILVCLIPGSETALTLIKIGSSVVYIASRLFIYCYLFENINIQRELVNFSIYSCNWTKMNLKFKNLLLFTLRMNDANQMVIKASPKKIIDLQLFANIMSTSFNMVPVLLKITNSENHKSQ
ncbi:odorant receptor 46a-like [Rhopalosiphum padi]|uniref:odorant receptor 46a-like n=1 Tax=Rhopalosiphum padi TaxID=40932 RepID=UPI00298DEDEA|nr:odorant receptor 46a-like [Rhopalosiphum padi]